MAKTLRAGLITVLTFFLANIAGPARALLRDPEAETIIRSESVNDSAGEAVSPPEQCLMFLHIPKTGGTSITSLNLHQAPQHRLYHELAERYYDKYSTKHKGTPTAGGWFDHTHRTKPSWWRGSQAAFYLSIWGLRANFHRFWFDHQVCQDLHAPTSQPQVMKYFTEDGCTTFCVVRDPLERLISAYKFWGEGFCSAKAFSRWLVVKRALTSRSIYRLACHLVPQVEYVYGAKHVEQSTRQVCTRILHTSNLTEEFNELMHDFGRSAELKRELFKSSDTCDIRSEDVSRAAKDYVYNFYREDYKAFGFPRP